MTHTAPPTLTMALHFSSERPEDQFYTDFGNLNRFGEEVGTLYLNHQVKLVLQWYYHVLLHHAS